MNEERVFRCYEFWLNKQSFLINVLWREHLVGGLEFLGLEIQLGVFFVSTCVFGTGVGARNCVLRCWHCFCDNVVVAGRDDGYSLVCWRGWGVGHCCFWWQVWCNTCSVFLCGGSSSSDESKKMRFVVSLKLFVSFFGLELFLAWALVVPISWMGWFVFTVLMFFFGTCWGAHASPMLSSSRISSVSWQSWSSWS